MEVDEPAPGREKRDRRSSRDRSRDRHHKKERRKHRSRSRSRDRRRSRSRDRRRRSRSRSRDRRRRSRSRSRSRDRYCRHSDRRSGSRGRRRGSDSEDEYGYKPRRRQEPAKPTASMFATNDPFAHLRQKAPQDPTEAMRQWQEQMLKSRQLVLAQQAQSAAQQANKAQRELYIGNLAAGAVTDAMLQQVFDSALQAAFPEAKQPGNEPVVKASVHSDGRYAFVEFRSTEFCTAALALNGQIQLMGTTISIGRPASYIDPNRVNEAAVQAEAALAAFRAGLPLPASAGLPNIPLPGSVDAAMAAAGQAVAASHNEAAVAAGTLPADAALALPPPPGLPGLDAGLGAGLPALLPGALGLPRLPGLPGLLPLGSLPGPPSGGLPVGEAHLCIDGMISADVLEDDEEYQEVLLDLEEECSKHGKVLEVRVPRPEDPKTSRLVFGSANFGKAFVKFADAAGAQAAFPRIHGRKFAGSLVSASFVSAAAYTAATVVLRLPLPPPEAAAGGEAGAGAAAAAGGAEANGHEAQPLPLQGYKSDDEGDGGAQQQAQQGQEQQQQQEAPPAGQGAEPADGQQQPPQQPDAGAEPPGEPQQPDAGAEPPPLQQAAAE